MDTQALARLGEENSARDALAPPQLDQILLDQRGHVRDGVPGVQILAIDHSINPTPLDFGLRMRVFSCPWLRIQVRSYRTSL
jgi:hypothetical protein